jgi:hypothetical protein
MLLTSAADNDTFYGFCNNVKIYKYFANSSLFNELQHCLIIISIFPAVVNVNCTYPKGWTLFFSVNMGFIVYLFGRFYKNTYLNKRKNK